MKSGYLPYVSAFLISLIACRYEPGIREVNVTFDTIPFDRVRLETSSDVRIIQSDAFQVSIQGMENDVADIDVRVINDKLTIEEHGHHPDELVIKVFVPEISKLECTGSSLVYGESNFQQDRNMDISLEGSGELDFAIETDDVDLEQSGSGYVYLEGSIKNLDADITGSGWLRSFKLLTDFSDVRIEGSGSAEINVSTDLDVVITGSGDVFYKGHPDINAQITGTGEVIDSN
jgi:hypothetical protein